MARSLETKVVLVWLLQPNSVLPHAHSLQSEVVNHTMTNRSVTAHGARGQWKPVFIVIYNIDRIVCML